MGKLASVQPLPPDGGSDPADSTPLAGRRPIDRRQFLQLSALGAAGFATTSRLRSTRSTTRVPPRARRVPGPCCMRRMLTVSGLIKSSTRALFCMRL